MEAQITVLANPEPQVLNNVHSYGFFYIRYHNGFKEDYGGRRLMKKQLVKKL